MKQKKTEVKEKLSVEFNCRFIFDSDLDHWVCHMDGNGGHGVGANLPLALEDLLLNLNNASLKNFIVVRQMKNAS